MVSECANPDCGAASLFFREGNLIAVKTSCQTIGMRTNSVLLALCKCASRMTLNTALKNSCRVTAEPGIPMPVAGKEIRQSSEKNRSCA